MRLIDYFARLALAVLFFTVPSIATFAQDLASSDVVVTVAPTAVVFNWGQYLAIVLANVAQTDVFWAAFMTALTFLLSFLPAPVRYFWNLFRLEQLLQKAVAGAINSTAGAVQGKTLSIDVANPVIARALQYAEEYGGKGLIEWSGGMTGIQDKLIARLPLGADVDIDKLIADGVATPSALSINH